ncbi:MAG: IS3 family transposase, partial [Phycisphaerales bacterium]|nr:IS3 family transposase [Phycisphaerales bacterium]
MHAIACRPAGGARPPTQAMIAFIDDHRMEFGVEQICSVRPITPSPHHEHLARRRDPSLLSERARRDLALKVKVRQVFEENFGVYGVSKVWRQLRREGHHVVGYTVARLMRELGLRRIVPGKTIRSTVGDKAAPCPLDKVSRQFRG